VLRPVRLAAAHRLASVAGSVVLVAAMLSGCGGSASQAPASPGASAGATPAPSRAPAATPSSRVTGTLTTGSPVKIASGSSTPGTDTTIEPSSPGGAGAGFSIEVPGDAYAAPKSFSVTSAPITGSTFGPLVKPVSELFMIENGGGYAAVPLIVRIPATIPADAVAGAFFYDPATGSLEGVPAVARDETGMTVITRHFSSILIAIAEAGLPDTIDSGFIPAQDSWQIPNAGSAPEPEGYCSGVATTAMWYFLERYRAGADTNLSGTYDNNGRSPTSAFWQDDARAIRLVTVVQHETDWGRLAARFFFRAKWFPGKLAYDAFRYSMAVTGEPQLILVRNATAAHAMIVYKVDPDRLWIADPNFPGEERSTTYNRATKTVAPYVGSETFDTILYAAKTAVAPWPDIAAAWDASVDGTIGKGVFSGYNLQVAPTSGTGAGSPVDLADGYETDAPSVAVSVTAPFEAYLKVYRGTQEIGSGQALPGHPLKISLENGDNELGFLVEDSPVFGPSSVWADFRRLVITRTPAASPSPTLEGAWMMVAGPDEIDQRSPTSGAGWSTEGGAGSIESWISSKKEDFTVAFSWTAPTLLSPGEPLDLGAAIGIKKLPEDCKEKFDFICDFSAEIDAGLLVMSPPSDPQQGPQPIVSATGRGQRWNATAQETVPAYDKAYGTEMVLQVGILHGDASRWYQYAYEWTGTP
jgi:hypothetical protein